MPIFLDLLLPPLPEVMQMAFSDLSQVSAPDCRFSIVLLVWSDP
jgi:hypothetical protein